MKKCSHCEKIIWPWQKRHVLDQLHARCFLLEIEKLMSMPRLYVEKGELVLKNGMGGDKKDHYRKLAEESLFV